MIARTPAISEAERGEARIVANRREQLTIKVFEDFLRKVWKERIEFVKLNITSPASTPIGPTTVIADNVGFVRPS
jgi:hypothetical protein